MELKTIKEFAHKNNLGEGLKFESGLFQLDLDKEFNTIASSLNQLNAKVTLINEQLGTVYKVKGSTTVSGINSMTVGNAMVGNVYNLTDSGVITNGIGGELNVLKGDNVVYTENGWDLFAASLDLDQCAGLNISIENNVINAEGYIYDKYNKSITFGSKYNEATNYLAFALGDGTTASGEKAHAEGGQTTASGRLAHAEGSNTIAKGDFSHSEGKGTLTNNESEHALGMYNISNTGTDADNRTTLYSIGVGTSSENKNAHEVMNNGDTFIIGIGDYKGTNPYESQTLLEVVNSKVDKEDNKGLSTEDYTTEEKTKLNSIEEGALVNIQSDWNLSDETLKDYIKNKPDLTVYLLKEEGKSLTSNDYTNSDKEKVSLIESLQTIVLELQEKINSKEYSIDFESDSTTAQEINLMDSMSLKKLVGYNITGVNVQIGTGSAVNLTLTDNVWEGDPIVINQGERIYWDIVKYDESAPAVLGIYETKIL